MDVTIEINAPLKIVVEDVAHPVHAINRLAKFLRENEFVLSTDAFSGYNPPGEISIQMDLLNTANELNVDKHVVDPPVWLDQGDIDSINALSWLLDAPTADRVRKLIKEHRLG
jgi:hypothetical protein